MGKNIVAVIVGLLVGGLVIMGIQMISHSMYPMPEGLDYKDKVVMAEYIKGLPFMALFMVLASYLIGSLVAGLVSTKIVGVSHIKLGLACGLILLLGVLFNLYSIPHPIWFMITSFVLTIPFAILGAKLVSTK